MSSARSIARRVAASGSTQPRVSMQTFRMNTAKPVKKPRLPKVFQLRPNS